MVDLIAYLIVGVVILFLLIASLIGVIIMVGLVVTPLVLVWAGIKAKF